MELKPGDVVTLKSGGHPLTVVEVDAEFRMTGFQEKPRNPCGMPLRRCSPSPAS